MYYFITQRKFRENWVRFDVLFIIGYTIVHFQIPFLASIGVEPSNPNFIWINIDVVNFATWMSTVSITFWLFGYSFLQRKNKVILSKWDIANVKVNYMIYDTLLLIIFILFLSTVGGALFAGTYEGTSNWGVGSVYAFLILQNLLYLRVIYFFKDLPKNMPLKRVFLNLLNNKIFSIIAIMYIFLFLIQGDRGPVLQILLIIAGSYVIFVKPISFFKLLSFVIVGAFLFTIISLGRGSDASKFDEGNIFQRGLSSYNDISDDTNITDELASSVRIQYTALNIVPEIHPYLYGQIFLFNIVGVIPFMSSTLIHVFNIPEMYLSSAKFFTIMELGPNPEYGVGSELLADIFINFGLFGTFIIMFLFGWFVNNSFNKAYLLNMTYIIIYLSLFCYSIYFNRSELLTPLKSMCYMLFFNFLFTRVLRFK